MRNRAQCLSVAAVTTVALGPTAEPTPESTPTAGAPAEAGLWPVAVLGIPFDPLTLDTAVDNIGAMVAARSPHYVVTANVDFLVQSLRDTVLRRILVDADLVLCDGTPLVWASRWLGNPLPGRAAGADLVPLLLRRAEREGWKIFMLGGAEGVAAEAAQKIAQNYPTLPPVAYYSPPFKPLAQMDNAEISRRIAAAKPDILLVGFGCPKQEKWISMHYRTLGVPVAIGVGGTIDFLAGRMKRAPRWMRHTGAEWLFRLAQEPRRLFRRYADDLMKFFPALIAQRVKLPPADAASTARSGPNGESTPYGMKIAAGRELHFSTLDRSPAFWRTTLEQKGHCLVDLSEIQSIDSTGVAFLALWQKRLAKRRRNLILFCPSAAVRTALTSAGIIEQFIITDGVKPGPSA